MPGASRGYDNIPGMRFGSAVTLTGSSGVRLGVLLCLLILAVNVLSVSSRLGFLHKPKQVKELDHYRYIEMARGPEGRPELTREATYCWRILVPALARLPVPDGTRLPLDPAGTLHRAPPPEHHRRLRARELRRGLSLLLSRPPEARGGARAGGRADAHPRRPAFCHLRGPARPHRSQP